MSNPKDRPAEHQSAWLFIDWWNCNRSLKRSYKNPDDEWEIDWVLFWNSLIAEVRDRLHLDALKPAGASVFSAYAPGEEKSERHWKFCHGTLKAKYGYDVRVLARTSKPRSPECRNPKCEAKVSDCPHCGRRGQLARRSEKGVDTALAFRMAQVAMRNEANILILASGDSDFVPIVEAVQGLGCTVFQAAFRSKGKSLQGEILGDYCKRDGGGVIDINSLRDRITFTGR